jgi:hypothetical protein
MNLHAALSYQKNEISPVNKFLIPPHPTIGQFPDFTRFSIFMALLTYIPNTMSTNDRAPIRTKAGLRLFRLVFKKTIKQTITIKLRMTVTKALTCWMKVAKNPLTYFKLFVYYGGSTFVG